MPDETHPIEDRIKEINSAKAAQAKTPNPFAYNPATHDAFVRSAVNPWALDDTVKNSLLSCKTNLVVGATYPSGASASADRLKVSVTADYLTVGGIGLAAVNIVASALDTGSLATQKWYAVHVICDSRGEQIAGLLSLSATAPTLPAGKTLFRRVGWVRSGDSVAEFYRIIHTGDSWWWNEDVTSSPFAVAAGSYTVRTAISCAAAIPTTSRLGYFYVYCDGDPVTFQSVQIRPTGGIRASGPNLAMGFGSATTFNVATQTSSPVSSSQSIEIIQAAAGTSAAYVVGYQDVV